MMRPDRLPAALSPNQASVVKTRVVSNEAVNGEYRLLIVATSGQSLTAAPGQFFQLLCPPIGHPAPYIRRPMSIFHVDAANGTLSFLYKIAGRGTAAMATLRPDDIFDVFGPLGIGFTLPPNKASLVILGRGVGLATLSPLAQWATTEGHKVTAILSARSRDVLMNAEALEGTGANVVIALDSDGSSALPQIETVLRDLHAAGALGAIYTCGSNRLLTLAQRLCAELDLFGEVALEQQMACGLGMCFCCVRPFRKNGIITERRVCCEGPVFSIEGAMAC